LGLTRVLRVCPYNRCELCGRYRDSPLRGQSLGFERLVFVSRANNALVVAS